jgi:hypothetical protein
MLNKNDSRMVNRSAGGADALGKSAWGCGAGPDGCCVTNPHLPAVCMTPSGFVASNCSCLDLAPVGDRVT